MKRLLLPLLAALALPTATCAFSMGHDERIFKETYLKAINKKDMSDIHELL